MNDGELSEQEHRERVRAATYAVTLGDLRAVVDDPQADSGQLPAPAGRPSPKLPTFGGWHVLAVGFVVSVLLGVGVGWGLYGNTSSPLDFTSDPGVKADGVGPVALSLSVYVSSDYGSGFIVFAGDGVVKRVNMPS